MSASIDMANSRIAVIGVSGEHLMWADEDQAHDFLKNREVHLIRRRGRARVLQAVAGWTKPGEVDPLGRGTALDRTRYSHRHEADDNPPNVWTLIRQAHPAPFVRVLIDCMA